MGGPLRCAPTWVVAVAAFLALAIAALVAALALLLSMGHSWLWLGGGEGGALLAPARLAAQLGAEGGCL